MRGNRVRRRQPQRQSVQHPVVNVMGLIVGIIVVFLVFISIVGASGARLDTASVGSHAAVLAFGIIAGWIGAVGIMHYKEAGAVGKAISHISGAVTGAANSQQVTLRREWDSVNKEKGLIAARQRDLNQKERYLITLEGRLRALQAEIEQRVRSAIERRLKELG